MGRRIANRRNYNRVYDVVNDVDLFFVVRKGTDIDLGMIQNIAINRWQWIVDNWATLYERFKSFADGDGDQELTLERFDREVLSFRLGSLQNPLDNTDRFIDFSVFLSNISIGELTLTPEEEILVSRERDRVERLEMDDFIEMLNYINQEAVLSSFSIGLGDSDGARLYGLFPTSRLRGATIADLEVIEEMFDLSRIIEGIIIDFKNSQDRPPNLISIANSNLGENTDFSFVDTFRSSVSVPFEISLEHMSKKFLGDENLIFELITVNSLQPPYVDEVGQKVPLIAPGAVNNIIVSDLLKAKIPVGTKIRIGSYRVREESRIIERVVDNQNGTLILFLSGAQDLSKLQTDDAAFIRVFEPSTVNTGSFILIPLQSPSPIRSTYTPASDELRRLSGALLNFGVDILRNEKTGAYVVDSNGNFAQAAGLRNVRQAVLNALKTALGELPFHPGYGISADIGGTYYGTADEAVIFANAVRLSLLQDPRYSDIQVLELSATNTGISLTFLVSIVGVDGPVPLSFIS